MFEDGLRNQGRSFAGERHRRGIRRSFPLDIGKRNIMFPSETNQLLADAMDEYDLDRQAPQNGDVGHDIGKILVTDDRAIDGHDEDVVAEHGDITKDPPEVGGLHGALSLAGHTQSLWTPCPAGQY